LKVGFTLGKWEGVALGLAVGTSVAHTQAAPLGVTPVLLLPVLLLSVLEVDLVLLVDLVLPVLSSSSSSSSTVVAVPLSWRRELFVDFVDFEEALSVDDDEPEVLHVSEPVESVPEQSHGSDAVLAVEDHPVLLLLALLLLLLLLAVLVLLAVDFVEESSSSAAVSTVPFNLRCTRAVAVACPATNASSTASTNSAREKFARMFVLCVVLCLMSVSTSPHENMWMVALVCVVYEGEIEG
jgi:hypothetical protein